MATGILLLEFALLAFIGIVYYLAKRDLRAAAALQQKPAVQEMREVQETVEGLIAVLDAKATEVEERLLMRFEQLELLERRFDARALAPPPMAPVPAPRPIPTSVIGAGTGGEPLTPLQRALAMVEQGSDPRAVARVTGATLAEIETALRMRQLRASSAAAPSDSNSN